MQVLTVGREEKRMVSGVLRYAKPCLVIVDPVHPVLGIGFLGRYTTPLLIVSARSGYPLLAAWRAMRLVARLVDANQVALKAALEVCDPQTGVADASLASLDSAGVMPWGEAAYSEVHAEYPSAEDFDACAAQVFMRGMALEADDLDHAVRDGWVGVTPFIEYHLADWRARTLRVGEEHRIGMEN